jgi:hypothetical protein
MAIQASLNLVGDDIRDDPFDYPFSFCIPIGKKPIVGISPGKLMLVALVLGFVFLGLAAWIGDKADKAAAAQSTWLVITPSVLGISGFGCFFTPFLLQRRIVSWCIGSRGKSLLARSGRADSISCELSRPDDTTISIDGEDHILMLFDKLNKRVLIEGVGARYLIRSDDVLSIRPFEFMGYIGAALSYQIDEETVLRVAIARNSFWKEVVNQIPILLFVEKWLKNRVLEMLQETLR